MSVKFKWETEFKETKIGEIPRDWNIRELKDICEVNKFPKGKKGTKGKFYSNGGYSNRWHLSFLYDQKHKKYKKWYRSLSEYNFIS